MGVSVVDEVVSDLNESISWSLIMFLQFVIASYLKILSSFARPRVEGACGRQGQ